MALLALIAVSGCFPAYSDLSYVPDALRHREEAGVLDMKDELAWAVDATRRLEHEERTDAVEAPPPAPDPFRTELLAAVRARAMGDGSAAFARLIALVERDDQAERAMVLEEITRLLVDDDWDRDGRKDRFFALRRPEVRAWLDALRDRDRVVLSIAELAARSGRCLEARRIRRGADVPAAEAAGVDAAIGACR